MMKRTIALLFVAFFILSSVSCSMVHGNHETFNGGEILDDEKMSEIRSQIYSTFETETVKDEATQTDKTETNEEETETNEDETDNSSSETETESDISSSDTVMPEETETSMKADVYWIESGEVWHIKRDCRYLKNKTVVSGSVEDAVAAGKIRACSACGK